MTRGGAGRCPPVDGPGRLGVRAPSRGAVSCAPTGDSDEAAREGWARLGGYFDGLRMVLLRGPADGRREGADSGVPPFHPGALTPVGFDRQGCKGHSFPWRYERRKPRPPDGDVGTSGGTAPIPARGMRRESCRPASPRWWIGAWLFRGDDRPSSYSVSCPYWGG